MRIAMSIAIAIALTLAAALAPLQQARGWAATCADGNTDVCCHLEQLGWTTSDMTAVGSILLKIGSARFTPTAPECSPWSQRLVDDAMPLWCQTDCWGGAIGRDGSWITMPTAQEVLTYYPCRVNFLINGTCPPAEASSSTAEPTPSSSSSTASATESSSSSSSSSTTGASSSSNAHTDGGASSAPLGPAGDEDSIGAAAHAHQRLHWAVAFAFALVLWH